MVHCSAGGQLRGAPLAAWSIEQKGYLLSRLSFIYLFTYLLVNYAHIEAGTSRRIQAIASCCLKHELRACLVQNWCLYRQ